MKKPASILVIFLFLTAASATGEWAAPRKADKVPGEGADEGIYTGTDRGDPSLDIVVRNVKIEQSFGTGKHVTNLENLPVKDMVFRMPFMEPGTYFPPEQAGGTGNNPKAYARFPDPVLIRAEAVIECREPENPSEEDLIFTPETGKLPGCYNIHGIEDDESLDPPSLDPEDWEILNDGNPVVRHDDTIGGRKIDPVGFYFTGNNLALLYNSGWASYDDWESGMATNQTGSLIAFNDDFTGIKDYPKNPVLYDWSQSTWQSKNRVNPYALVWHPYHEVFYCFYGDFSAKADDHHYPGRRALGLAKSADLINWEYITREEPLFHINTLKNLASEAGSDLFEGYEDITHQGRVYANGAVFHENHIYLTIAGSIAREMNYAMVVRAEDPKGNWELVESNVGGRGAHRPTPIFIDGKWYYPQNMRDPFDPDYRAIGIGVSDGITEPAEVHYLFSTGHTSSAGASRQLFAYKGRWYIAYRQADDENYRDMYIARQR